MGIYLLFTDAANCPRRADARCPCSLRRLGRL